MNMAKDKFQVIYEHPPVHVTDSGSLSVDVKDIFHSQAGQDIIFRMEKMAPYPTQEKKDSTEKK
jgi:hypothetical protein